MMLQDIGINVLQLVTGTRDKDHIMEGVWIGNHKASEDVDFLVRERIEVIFNCTKNHIFADVDGIIKYRIPVNDNIRDLSKYRKWIDWASYILNHHMRDGRTILIHCHAGLQRSATLLAYTLIRYRGYTIERCLDEIRARRPMAFPFPFTFKKLLESAERRYHGQYD